MVIKRSMATGYAGLDNDLFYNEKTMMIFGDAKKVVEDMTKNINGGGHYAGPSNPAFIKRDLGRVKPPSGGFFISGVFNVSRRGVMHFQRLYLVHCMPAEQSSSLKKIKE